MHEIIPMLRPWFLALFFSLFLPFAYLSSAPADTPLFVFKGYLGQEEMAAIRQALDHLEAPQVILEVNATSGDLASVFEIAKKLFALKVERKLKIVVYLEDSALGPAALLPLLADQLYISPFVSWGDIPSGVENPPAPNILRNQAVSLVDPNHAHASLLQDIAAGMSDPSTVIIDDQGWKIVSKGEEGNLPVIKPAGETLVLNHHQLRTLRLVEGILTLPRFEAQWRLRKSQAEPILTTPSLSLVVSKEGLDKRLREYIKFNPQGPNEIGLISITGHTNEINQSTWLYVKNALDYYKQTKPIFIILELDTPGGEVYSAQKISDALKDLDTQYGIPVVAFINNWAISAGAMLAYSCRFITVVKDASMGAAEPLTLEPGSGKTEVASEKVNSAIRADFANRAAFFGRNSHIAEAMVDKDIILIMRHGKIIKLNDESQMRLTGPDPDRIIKPKGKLLTLNAQQMIEYGVADLLLSPQKTESLTIEETSKGRWPAYKMLLFTYPFFRSIPQTEVDAYKPDWKIQFFSFLSHPVVSSLLFMGLMIGFYVEISTPGFGIAGTIAVTCLALIILSSFALEVANWLELILLVLGLGIILIELFILPTFGLLGFIGILFFLFGLLGMMLPGAGAVSYEFDTKTLNAAGEVFFERLAWLCGAFVLAFAIILVLSRYLTPTWVGLRRLVLAGHEQTGYTAGDHPDLLPQPGSKGVALSALRPSGKVIIQDKIYDAMSRGSFIEKDTPIQVGRVEGSTIVVHAVKEPPYE
jgi:membrane-bound serine protease (ClpP class)